MQSSLRLFRVPGRLLGLAAAVALLAGCAAGVGISVPIVPGVSVGVDAPTLPGMSQVETALADVWATGVSVDSYPTQYVRDGLVQAGVITVDEASCHEAGRRVAVAGVV
ncbi:MAG: hypothetical protein IH616_10225, partial [Gemmatimonadales bacterium]|nr:hypothetical protein [Gemmatimonadales bacterium]